MFKLIALLAAGATLYTMGHNAAQASATGAAETHKPAAWEQVATFGGTWIARQVHDQTAWAADGTKANAQTADIQTADTDNQAVITIAAR